MTVGGVGAHGPEEALTVATFVALLFVQASTLGVSRVPALLISGASSGGEPVGVATVLPFADGYVRDGLDRLGGDGGALDAEVGQHPVQPAR